ncbi:MAG: flagellar M-ring protein FliF [Oscillospiraceae bacterium]|nr:flagellar M-ring protein FliF [Oscillospiraceae bacterium]
MRDRLADFWFSFKERWQNTTRQLRILLLGGGAVVLISALVAVLVLNHTEYTVLYNNLTVGENAEVLVLLNNQGVNARLEGNTILVPSDQEGLARMSVAMHGFPVRPLGYEIYMMGTGLTATQSDREFFYNAQAVQNLASVIRAFPEVRDVQVIINQQETGSFVFAGDRLPASVAIMIDRMPGRNLRAEQIQGIINMTMASVPGLSEENIAISDDTGNLRMMLDVNTGVDVHAQRLHLTEQVNQIFRRRIMDLLIPVYGEGGVEVRVNSVLDTTERSSEAMTYIPWDENDPANNPINFMESEQEQTTVGGPVGGVPGANDNVDVPQFGALADDNGNIHYYNRVVTDFLVSSERTMWNEGGFTIDSMSAAVIIDADALPNGERDVILDLVAMASGIPLANISVQNLAFSRPDGEEAYQPTTIFQNPLFWVGIALIILIVAGMTVWMILAAKKKKAAAAALIVEPFDYTEEASLAGMMPASEETFEPIQLPETPEQKLKGQIKDLADTDPEIVAQLIRTWLLSA